MFTLPDFPLPFRALPKMETLLFLIELWALFYYQIHGASVLNKTQSQLFQESLPSTNFTTDPNDEINYSSLLGTYPPSKHLKQFRLVIVWKNPYQLPNGTDSLLLARQDEGNDGGDNNGDVDGGSSSSMNGGVSGNVGNPTISSKNCGQTPCNAHKFDEMEQRDLIRTVIYLANGQINVKFKLCDLKRFRSEFRPQWNLYRCSARFTVTLVGKDCDNPEHCYDGYATFIVQNPELPPLLAIRYYVFQFLYEAPFQLVKKLNQKRDL